MAARRIGDWGLVVALCAAGGWACDDGGEETAGDMMVAVDPPDGAPPDTGVDLDRGPDGAVDAEAPGAPEPDHELITYLSNEFGFRMTRPFDAEEEVVDAEGRLVIRDRLWIELAGHGAREIVMDETYFPLAEGGGIGLVLTDAETGANRSFAWDVQANYVSLDRIAPDGSIEGATVVPNPDGSYSVALYGDDGQQMGEDSVTGRRAFEIVEQRNRYVDAPPHLVMTAFALAHTSPEEARIQVSCDDTAPIPPVSAVYSDFCKCVPCIVLADPAICARHCPEG